jgi:hypothetical protein
VAEHELRRVAELIANHACIVAAIVLEEVVIVDDHGRVDVWDLLLVLDSVGGYHGACVVVSY